MTTYNYYEEMKADIMQYIEDEKDYGINFDDYDTIEDLEEHLNEVLWYEDSITGNASGSYTFNTWEAEENLCHNLDLLKEACDTFGSDISTLLESAEICDVTIRCYLLGQVLHEVMEEIEDDFNAYKESEATEND